MLENVEKLLHSFTLFSRSLILPQYSGCAFFVRDRRWRRWRKSNRWLVIRRLDCESFPALFFQRLKLNRRNLRKQSRGEVWANLLNTFIGWRNACSTESSSAISVFLPLPAIEWPTGRFETFSSMRSKDLPPRTGIDIFWGIFVALLLNRRGSKKDTDFASPPNPRDGKRLAGNLLLGTGLRVKRTVFFGPNIPCVPKETPGRTDDR